MNLIKVSLRYPTVTVILTVLLVLVGFRAFFNMFPGTFSYAFNI